MSVVGRMYFKTIERGVSVVGGIGIVGIVVSVVGDTIIVIGDTIIVIVEMGGGCSIFVLYLRLSNSLLDCKKCVSLFKIFLKIIYEF